MRVIVLPLVALGLFVAADTTAQAGHIGPAPMNMEMRTPRMMQHFQRPPMRPQFFGNPGMRRFVRPAEVMQVGRPGFAYATASYGVMGGGGSFYQHREFHHEWYRHFEVHSVREHEYHATRIYHSVHVPIVHVPVRRIAHGCGCCTCGCCCGRTVTEAVEPAVSDPAVVVDDPPVSAVATPEDYTIATSAYQTLGQ